MGNCHPLLWCRDSASDSANKLKGKKKPLKNLSSLFKTLAKFVEFENPAEEEDLLRNSLVLLKCSQIFNSPLDETSETTLDVTCGTSPDQILNETLEKMIIAYSLFRLSTKLVDSWNVDHYTHWAEVVLERTKRSREYVEGERQRISFEDILPGCGTVGSPTDWLEIIWSDVELSAKEENFRKTFDTMRCRWTAIYLMVYLETMKGEIEPKIFTKYNQKMNGSKASCSTVDKLRDLINREMNRMNYNILEEKSRGESSQLTEEESSHNKSRVEH